MIKNTLNAADLVQHGGTSSDETLNDGLPRDIWVAARNGGILSHLLLDAAGANDAVW